MASKTPREKLREQLEESRRTVAALPRWMRECPPDFGPSRPDGCNYSDIARALLPKETDDGER